MKTPRRFLLIGTVIVAICIGTLIIYHLVTRDQQVEQTFHIYSNAKLIWQDQAVYGADVAQKNLYYWTEDQIQDVQNYYEGLFPKFLSGNAQNQWFITGFNLDNSPLTPNTNSSFLTHPSFCSYTKPNQCVTLALIRGDQDGVYSLPVISPKSFQYSVAPPQIASLPKRGTIIVYSYYTNSF